MTSPRIVRLSPKHSPLLLAALLVGLAAVPLRAQTVVAPATVDTATADTATAGSATPDTAIGARDTTSPPSPGARPDAARPDTLRDTTAAGARAQGARPPAAAPPPPAPVDSALAAACRESGGDPPDLLAVVFRTSATPEERQSAARDVGGTLVEQSRFQVPGAWYLHVPGSGYNPLVADRVIRLPPVLEVSATRCPS